MKITHEYAQMVKVAADKYLEHGLNHSNNIAGYRADHADLMKIVEMIKNDEDRKKIARAMWNLDTIVRDNIPDSVYYAYTS